MPATLHSSFFTPPPTLACVARAPREAPRRFSHASIRRQRSLPLDFGSLPVCGRWAPVLNALRPFFGQRVDLPRCWASPASRSCRLQERFSAVSSRWCVGGLVEESARAAVSLEGSVEGSLSSLVPDTHPTSASVPLCTVFPKVLRSSHIILLNLVYECCYFHGMTKHVGIVQMDDPYKRSYKNVFLTLIREIMNRHKVNGRMIHIIFITNSM